MARSRSSSGVPRDRFVRSIASGICLTDRDRRLLIDLARHRIMSRSHIVRLGYFNSIARANSRLRLLFDHAYVRRQFVPDGSYGAEALYQPGLASAELVTHELGLDRSEALKVCRLNVAPLFLAHSLKVLDLRIGFLECAKSTDFEVRRWLSESESFHEYALKDRSGKWKWHSLRPDACITASTASQTFNGFVECDLGNCSGRAFSEKIQRYSDYLSSGIYEETYQEAGFKVLTVTTGERRMRALLELSVVAKGPEFLFTTFASFESHGPYASIWRSSLGSEGVLLL